jgi:hypothetical protein
MPILEWDQIGDRVYESGLDRGVLYLPDGSAVPWNGLTSVVEKTDTKTNPVYFDGMKISDSITLGDFSATMTAITYPDEFEDFEGVSELRPGLFVGDQRPKTFGLCYRTKINNDLEGEVGYKIHLLYNVTAIPSDKSYGTLNDSPAPMEFSWTLSAVPEEVPGYRPTAHITLNSLSIDPWLLEDIEAILYGSTASVASILPMADLVSLINEWYRVKIVDNHDGTWTAISKRDGFIFEFPTPEGYFEIDHINAVYLDMGEFVLSDTVDISDVPEIRIDNVGDGTWMATTDKSDLIVVNDDGTFEILDANVEYFADSFTLSDTIEE